MELMKKVATRHGLVCLLHEKPFAGVNGSGKHNNWSLSTDSGVNLLEPGASPSENAQFLTYLTAIIKAIDEYQDLLRVSVATAGNDHRLGANEAPPAIVSVFLGEELGGIMDAIVNGRAYGKKEATQMQIGVDVLPRFPKDTTDRNRTSPFAFTGNKFEFRMLGSSLSISGPNFVLNTIVAEVLEEFANKLEKSKNFTADLNALIKETLSAHKRIIFNGNGYEDAWVKEAEKRGLSNLKTVPDALPTFIAPKSINLFVKHGVLSEVEIRSRYEIILENYCKTMNIEVLTMLDMISKDILPAVYKYLKDLSATTIAVQQALGYSQGVAKGAACKAETELITKLAALADALLSKSQKLEKASHSVREISEATNAAKEYAKKVIPIMQETRAVADEIESLLGHEYLPFPTYSDLLFSI
jgi:glutamine synthetase